MKIQEMREKTVEELSALILESKKSLFEMKFQKSLGKLEDSSKIAKTKKIIAQAKTIISEKNSSKDKEVIKNA